MKFNPGDIVAIEYDRALGITAKYHPLYSLSKEEWEVDSYLSNGNIRCYSRIHNLYKDLDPILLMPVKYANQLEAEFAKVNEVILEKVKSANALLHQAQELATKVGYSSLKYTEAESELLEIVEACDGWSRSSC